MRIRIERWHRGWKVLAAVCAAAIPALWAYSLGPDPFKTGGPFPGEGVCSESGCHTGAGLNKGPGSVTISVQPYQPGQTQTITVSVSDPNQRRWGFQLTARPANALTSGAGSFQPVDSNVQVICSNNFPAPCSPGTSQFAEHSSAPFTAVGAGFTFSVAWTAPSSDVGPIVFAAAGNAANGDGNNTGDNIYTTTVTVTACPSTGGPPPQISEGGIVGAGASVPPVTQISPNGLISIYGRNFAPAGTFRSVASSDLVRGQLPASLACACVRINNQPASMFFVSPGQINVQAPSLSGTGSMPVQVITGCGSSTENTSNTQGVTIQAASPEFFFFKQNAGGKNPIAATNALTGAPLGDPAVLGSSFTPAKPDSYVTLYSTGLGATNPAFPAGALPDKIASTANKVSVSLNGTVLADSDVLYAGVAPGFAGLYQINIHVPASMPDGNLPLSASVAGVSTPPGAFLTVKK